MPRPLRHQPRYAAHDPARAPQRKQRAPRPVEQRLEGDLDRVVLALELDAQLIRNVHALHAQHAADRCALWRARRGRADRRGQGRLGLGRDRAHRRRLRHGPRLPRARGVLLRQPPSARGGEGEPVVRPPGDVWPLAGAHERGARRGEVRPRPVSARSALMLRAF